MKKTVSRCEFFGGGKDSTAMLLHMFELGMPVDEVVNVDTGMEFPETSLLLVLPPSVSRRVTKAASDFPEIMDAIV